jgi:predicted TIM-barrel fold metal-dependent hydrolase
MSASPIDVVGQWMQNLLDPEVISRVVAPDARIMFASDYPYDMSTDAARWIEAAPISENDRRKICYGNAAALFGLPR